MKAIFHQKMLLRPLDILTILKLSVSPDVLETYKKLGDSIGVSPSQAHSAVRRAREAGLLTQGHKVFRPYFGEVLIYGVRFFIPAQEGAESRGMATSYGASPLKERFGEYPSVPVWPGLLGDARGPSVEPIYPTVPEAAQRDENLYRLLVLIDGVRIGRARERNLGREGLAEYFGVRLP